MGDVETKARKPLGRKGYGSIPHLPASRMGPADHSCHEGQAVICTLKARDRHDRVIVTEKLDGACMTIARIGHSIVPITRAGYHAGDGAFEHLRAFSPWVKERESKLLMALSDGQRICGEWLAMAHGTIYELGSQQPFIVFDVIEGERRLPHDEMQAIASMACLPTAHILSDGPPLSVADAMSALGPYGHHGATETVEGAVWRVERKGQFDFMAKFVRHDKQDGKYLPNVSGRDPIWLHPIPGETP